MATKEWKDRHKMFVRYSTLLPGQQKYSDDGKEISGRIETAQIYLAKPGKRKLGVLNGVREDSCHLDINLNNTAVLSFDVDRIVNGKVSNFYDRITRHMELQIPDIGWFKINEEPTISNDGSIETMSVRAESLEIELQQYILKGFEVNTGSVSSLEYLAPDNVYSINEHNEVLTGKQIADAKANGQNIVQYTFSRENVKFYRDTSEFEALLEVLPQDVTEEQLLEMIPEHPCLLDSWRIGYNLPQLDLAIQRLVELGEQSGQNMTSLKSQIGNVKSQQAAFTLTRLYPSLLTITNANGNRIMRFDEIDLTSYDEDHPEDYTLWEILDMELERRHNLSLLWVLLDQHNWKVGFVDNKIDIGTQVKNPLEDTEENPLYATENTDSQLTAIDFISSGSDDDLTPLCDKEGKFEIDSNSVYAFMTQDMASYFRCMFVFDTINNEVNCYSISHVGYDTNIFLSFRNIQNSVERSSEDELATVFYVQGGEELNVYEANFGQNYLTDISYFLTTDHFSQDFINKYKNWERYRENMRSQYIDYAIDYRKKLEAATELYDRVPVDGAETNQYASFSVEQLEEERKKYEALKQGYEDYYVDSNNEFDIEKLQNSDDWMDYSIIVDQILSSPLDAFDSIVYQDKYIDEDGETSYADYIIGVRKKDENGEYIKVDEHYVFEKDSYGNYIEDEDARLGNIDIAMMNRYIQDGAYVEDGDSAVIKKGKTNYRTQREYLEDYIYDFDTYGEAYGLGELLAQQTDLYNRWQALWSKGFGEPQDEDAEDYDQYHHEQYELYVKYYDAWESCNRAIEIRKPEYETAVSEYEAVAERMRDLEKDVDIENERFGFTKADLKLLDQYHIYSDYVNENIITTSISTAEEIVNTEYKVIKDAQEELYASSHPQYKWSTTQDNLLLMPEFHDWHGQLDIGNFIRVGFREDDPREEQIFTDDGYVISDEPVQLTKFGDNQIKMRIVSIGFNPFMIEPTIDITFSSMIQYKSRRNDFVELLNMSTNAAANQITAKIASQQKGDNDFIIDSKFVQKLLANGSFSGFMNGQTAGAVGSITSGSESLTIPIINALKVFAQDVEAQTVKAAVANFTEVYTKYLDADAVVARVLSAKEANFETLSTQLLTAKDMIVFNSVLQNSTVQTQWVKDQIANKIAVADLIAGDITVSDQMRIISENGYLVMDGNRLQIGTLSDENGNIIPQIQLGYATNNQPNLVFVDSEGNSGIIIGYPDDTGKPSISIYDTDGNIIIDSGGIADSGNRVIADELIVNDMVKQGTLDKSRFNFSVMEVGDDVTIEQLTYDGNGQWGTQLVKYLEEGIVTTGFNVDGIEGKINSRVSQTDFNDSISQVYSDISQTADGITQRVDALAAIANGTIQSVTIKYLQTASATTVPSQDDSGWSTTTPTWEAGKYIWQMTVTTTPNGESKSNPVCISGREGTDGSDGQGVVSVTPLYYITDSMATPHLPDAQYSPVPENPDGTLGWSSTCPTWESNKFIWTTSKIVYENPTETVYTEPYMDTSTQAYVAAHSEIEIQKDRISMIVANTQAESQLQLTPNAIQAISENVIIQDPSGSQTLIQGGKITVGGYAAISDYINNGYLTITKINDEYIYNVDSDPDLNNQQIYATGESDALQATGQCILYFDKINESEDNPWVYFQGIRREVIPFSVNLGIDGFATMSGYIVYRLSDDTQHIVYYSSDDNQWYGQTVGNEEITTWTWQNVMDAIVCSWSRDKYNTISYEAYYPCKGYDSIRMNTMLQNWGINEALVETTTINGGSIETGTITAQALSTHAIRSLIYSDVGSNGVYSSYGTWFNLEGWGFIKSKNFAITSTGDVYLRGNINAKEGYVGGWNILKKCLYSTNDDYTVVMQNLDINKNWNITDNEDGTYTAQALQNADNISISFTYEGNLYGHQMVILLDFDSTPFMTVLHTNDEHDYDEFFESMYTSQRFVYNFNNEYDIDMTNIYLSFSNIRIIQGEEYHITCYLTKNDVIVPWSEVNGGDTLDPESYTVVKGFPDDVVFGIKHEVGDVINVPFYVDKTGKLYAQNAELNGTIDATNGAIGGWNIGASTLSNSTYILDSSGGTTTTINGTSRPNLVFSIGNNFGVSSSGTLYTGGATINGSITATSLTAQTTYQIYTGNTTKDVLNIGTFTTGDFSFTNGIKIGNITDQAYWSCGDGGMSGKIISAGNNTSVYAKNFNGSTSVGAPTVYVNTLDTATAGVTTITCNAKLSGRITNADSASYADSAGSATNATNASYATSAGSATSANYATSAGSATSASSATIAGSAEYAEVAHKCKDNAQNNNRTPNCFIADDMRILKFINSSSREVKNIVGALDFEKYDEDIYNISTYWFKYKSEYLEKNGIKKEDQIDEVLYGFIAEDWEKYFPEAVIYNDDGTVENWNERSVIAFMFEMIKKEHKANKELKNDIEELKQIINELRRE